MYFELQPAYHRNFKSAAAVKESFLTLKQDFEGDFQLGFKLVNIDDIPKPCTVILRYSDNRKLVSLKLNKDGHVTK